MPETLDFQDKSGFQGIQSRMTSGQLHFFDMRISPITAYPSGMRMFRLFAQKLLNYAKIVES